MVDKKISELTSITGAEVEDAFDTIAIVDDSAGETKKISREELFKDVSAVDVDGDITVGGTVDGRNLSVDGTKLDGIEVNADVTDTANVTAAGALMNTGGTITGPLTVSRNADNMLIFDNTGASDTWTVKVVDPDNTLRFTWGTADTYQFSPSATLLASTSLVTRGNGDNRYLRKIGGTVGPLAVTGNIVLTGTVDGRDVAADGTKLDGIEAGADVTDTANVTAAGALMDSEVTNLDQVKNFDSADYATAAQGALADSATQPGDNISTLTNDAGYTTNVGDITGVTAGSGLTGGGTSGTVTVSHDDTSSQASVDNSGGTVIQDVTLDTFGHVTGLTSTNLDDRYYTETEADSRFVNTSGDTMSGNLTFGDGDKAVFGESSDLQIYHDGSNSFVKDAGTGNLILQGDNSVQLRSVTGNQAYFFGAYGGASYIYHAGSAKLATTSTGVDVTGTATADGLTVNKGSDGSDIVSLTGASSGRYLNIQSFENSGAAGAGYDLNATSGQGAIRLSTVNLPRLLVGNNGDISFYEDTGTTAQMTWDASADALTFGDNVKAVFGESSDLQIYHDGSNSYVRDVGTGDLKIQGAAVSIETAGGNLYFKGDANVASLYHTNNLKLATTSTGVDVTGTVTSDFAVVGEITDGNYGGYTSAITINTGSNGTEVAALELVGATNGSSRVDFRNVTYNHSAIVNIVGGGDAGSGNLYFRTNVNSATAERDRMKVAYNGDISFYEDTGTTPKFFWDASAESLGIKTTSPGSALDVNGSITTDGLTSSDPITVSRNADNMLVFDNTGASNDWTIKVVDLDDTMRFTFGASDLYWFESDGQLNSGSSVVTRSKGDARYLQLSGGELTGNLGVLGNIVLTGTVDGRDVAADGTKLDGIEAGADVTDAANVEAAGAVMAAGDTMTGQLLIDVDDVANGALRINANQTNPNNDFYFAQEIFSALSGSTATTADREQGGIYIDVNSTATGGDTSNEHRAYGMYVDLDSTGDSSAVYGVYADATATPSTGTTSQIVGLYGVAEDNGGAGSTIGVYGVRGIGRSDNSTSDVNSLYGGHFVAQAFNDSGPVSNAFGIFADIDVASGAGDVLGPTYVVKASYDNNSGVEQTSSAYLFHGDYQGTLPTNAYGVYIPSDVTNYFAGDVGVGTNSPIRALDVRSGTTDVVANFESSDSGAFIALQDSSTTTNTAVMIGANGDDLRFDAGDLERMRIDSNGNVGIGTSSPTDISGYSGISLDGSTGGLITLADDGVEQGRIIAAASQLNISSSTPTGEISLRTGGTGSGSEAMRITSNGDVGIGTSSPSAVGSRRTVNVSGSAGSAIRLSDDTANMFIDYTDSTGGRISVNAAEPLIFRTSSVERMRIDSSGRVGINTTSPSGTLTVTDGDDGLEIGNEGVAGTTRIFAYDRNASSEINLIQRAASHQFQTNATERMRIDSSGRVGINTTNPGSELDVNGSITTDGLTVNKGSDGSDIVSLTGASSGRYLNIQSFSNSGAAGAGYDLNATSGQGAIRLSTVNLPRLLVGNNGDISFYEDTGTTAKLFWDASAESLGIGTISPEHLLHVAKNGATTVRFGESGGGDSTTLELGKGYDSTSSIDFVRSGIVDASISVDPSENLAIDYNQSNLGSDLRIKSNSSTVASFDSSGNLNVNGSITTDGLTSSDPITVSRNADNMLVFDNTGASDDWTIKVVDTDDTLRFTWGAGDIYNFSSGATLPYSSSVVTRGNGDGRYLQLSGGTLTGATTVETRLTVGTGAAGSINGDELALSKDQANVGMSILSADATGQSRIYFGSQTDTQAAMIRHNEVNNRLFVQAKGDLYFQTGGTTTRATLNTSGDLDVTGALSKGSGSFKIDHPLKPDTHHLVHSFIEGPQADNIYRGRVDLVDGTATVNLDTAGRMTEGTFVALNGNVQCFTTNEDGWTAVRGSVSGNVLTIEAQDATCTDTVSWMVIGERKDQHMLDTGWTDTEGRIITEPEKPAVEEN